MVHVEANCIDRPADGLDSWPVVGDVFAGDVIRKLVYQGRRIGGNFGHDSFSRLLAIDFFSMHFPFPASYMPVSFGIATIMLAFAFTFVVFALLAFIFEIGMLLLLSLNDFKNPLFVTSVVATVFAVGFIGAYSASIAVFQGIDSKGQLLLIKLAEKYDFTTNHLCEAHDNESVLFIDNVADRAIAATFPKIRKIPPRKISERSLNEYMPANFHMVRCNPISPPNGAP